MKKCKKTPKENVKDLEKYLAYADKFKDYAGAVDDLNFMYESFDDPDMMMKILGNIHGLTGFLNFASIGMLTAIEGILEEEKRRALAN